MSLPPRLHARFVGLTPAAIKKSNNDQSSRLLYPRIGASAPPKHCLPPQPHAKAGLAGIRLDLPGLSRTHLDRWHQGGTDCQPVIPFVPFVPLPAIQRFDQVGPTRTRPPVGRCCRAALTSAPAPGRRFPRPRGKPPVCQNRRRPFSPRPQTLKPSALASQFPLFRNMSKNCAWPESIRPAVLTFRSRPPVPQNLARGYNHVNRLFLAFHNSSFIISFRPLSNPEISPPADFCCNLGRVC